MVQGRLINNLKGNNTSYTLDRPTGTTDSACCVRKRLKISRALFTVYLRTNVLTLENWEQGRAKPNAQAALLINLVKRYRTQSKASNDLIRSTAALTAARVTAPTARDTTARQGPRSAALDKDQSLDSANGARYDSQGKRRRAPPWTISAPRFPSPERRTIHVPT